LSIEPDNVKAKYRLGLCFSNLGYFEEAIKEMRECEKLDPNFKGYQE